MKVHALPILNLSNVPEALRQIANRMEAGDFTVENCVVCWVQENGEPSYSALGHGAVLRDERARFAGVGQVHDDDANGGDMKVIRWAVELAPRRDVFKAAAEGVPITFTKRSTARAAARVIRKQWPDATPCKVVVTVQRIGDG